MHLTKEQQIKAIASQFILNSKHDNFYYSYLAVLNKAVEFGYTSTIVCPIMKGFAADWGMFLASITNEIVDFTQIMRTPCCLISGGTLDDSKRRNEEFFYHFLSNVRPIKETNFLYCNSFGQGLLVNRLPVGKDDYNPYLGIDKPEMVKELEESRFNLKQHSKVTPQQLIELRAVFIEK
ncbi:MAG: hypothetical protein QNJ31_08910 [Candidatus Caenarcaniphilales bacterium]|nr:hypothetical protein [Candidatus Caenarcaniphilales bacterium]